MKRFDYGQKRKIKLLSFLIFLSLVVYGILLFMLKKSDLPSGIVINEVCSRNFSVYEDETDDYPDYVELYNAGEEPFSLEGLYLSDDEKNLQKMSLMTKDMQPGEHYVIWLNDVEQEGNAKIKINSQGEELFLSNDSNVILDSVKVPSLQYNTSYGRIEDGGNDWAEMSTTFGESNNDAEIIKKRGLSTPVFSKESGFYDEDFLLSISARDGEKIYYTLDGSNPTLESYLYTEPITISDASLKENIYSARTDLSPTRNYVPDFKVDKATIVRAMSYNEKNNCISEIETKVYFVGYSAKEEYRELPIISLVTEPANLFDYEYGIYTNGKKYAEYAQNGGMVDGVILDHYTDEDGQVYNLYEASNCFNVGKEWEREATITFFDNTHSYCFDQNVGIRISGASTRSTPQKSFNIFGRDIYDNQVYFPTEFFPGIKSSTFKLRNGGNENSSVKITDAFLAELVADRNVSVQRSVPCILFLNGEYWGIYNIRERYDEEYLWNYYNVNTDNVFLIDEGGAKVGDAAALEAYEYMLALVTECDLSYDDVYAMVAEQIDVQSLIDYFCINLYTDNQDLSLNHNVALWRTIEHTESEYGDTKWRYMIFDMDDTLSDYSDMDPAQWMQEYRLFEMPVIRSFMRNEQFKKQLCISLMDIANINYSYENVHEKLMIWENIYGEQIVKNHQRFFEADFDIETFHSYIKDIDEFFENRFEFVMAGMAEEFSLSGSLEPIHIICSNPDGGDVFINTSQTDLGEEWKGQYYNDYPVILTAVAAEGYRFAGWSGDINTQESNIEIMIPEGGLSLQATFIKE